MHFVCFHWQLYYNARCRTYKKIEGGVLRVAVFALCSTCCCVCIVFHINILWVLTCLPKQSVHCFNLTHAVAQLVEALRHKLEGRGFVEIFHWITPSGHIMALGSTQPLMSIMVRSGGKGWQLYHLHVPIVLKSWEPQRTGTLGAWLGLYRNNFTLLHFLANGVSSR